VRVVGLQHDIVWEDAAATHAAVAPRIEQAVADGADLVVLTEMFATGFAIDPAGIAEPAGGPSERFLLDRARHHGVVLVGSVAQWGDDGRARNVCLVATPDGIAARYPKIHPFRYGGEHLHYAPGEEVVTLELGGVRVTPFVCYDLRFAPEFWEAAPSTDCYIVVANWPMERREHWMALLRARAIENLAYVVGVNRVGEGGGLRYSGDSTIVSPWGETLAHLADDEGVVAADIDPAEVARIRATYPFLEDR
jgi:predicted amidohydrolase